MVENSFLKEGIDIFELISSDRFELISDFEQYLEGEKLPLKKEWLIYLLGRIDFYKVAEEMRKYGVVDSDHSFGVGIGPGVTGSFIVRNPWENDRQGWW